MKNIKINDEETYYFIDENGQLFNSKTNRYYKGSISGGYLKYDLPWKDKKYARFAHRLVAEAFLDNNLKLPVVNHKDGNKLNNSVSNLEWVSYSENNIHAYETGLKVKSNGVSNRVKFEGSLPNEEWKQYYDTTYYISNMGRAKNIKTNNLLKGKITNKGYCEWCFTINGNKKSLLAHRIVYELFGQEKIDKDKVINHKNGIKSDNRIDNLEQIKQKDNIVHSYYSIGHSNVKQVGQYDLQKNLLNIYPSCAEAARQNPGCYANNISRVCNGYMDTHHGFIWKYIDKE